MTANDDGSIPLNSRIVAPLIEERADGARFEVATADAALMVAAPDLLAALRWSLDYLDGWPADSEQRKCRDAAHSAIARAEGR